MNKPLLENLYKVLSLNESDPAANEFTAEVALDPDHDIYKGHFPGFSVTPGVVLVQIIKEVLEKKLDKTLFLSEGDNIKFLAPILPKKQNSLLFQFNLHWENESEIVVRANGLEKGTHFLKFKGKFKVV